MLGVALQHGGLAHLESAGDGGGEALHFAGLENFAGAFAENTNDFRLGDAAAGHQDGDGGLDRTCSLNDFTQFDVGETFGAGDDEVGGTAAELVKELAAVF
jgi:hypothetical protein